jgi:hippurate hydrolase
MRRGVLFLLAAASAWSQPLANAELDKLIEPDVAYLDALYKHLHAHPELSFREKETSARIAQEFRAAGFEVTTNVGGYGVVAVLRNGPGKTLLLRTDLDGLPVEEKTGRPYASKVRTQNDEGIDTGVMHACGHDIHMSVVTGAARLLPKLRDRWSGTLVVIAQPAEERGGGALAMLKDGLYRRFPRPDFALAPHTDAALEAGRIGFRAGYAMANVDSVDLTVRGLGGHGAYAHATKDPVVLAAQIILGLQTIVSREIRAVDAAVVSVGSIHGGTKHNIIPDEVKLQLTVRSYSEATREQILTSIRRIANGYAKAAGLPEDRMPVMRVLSDDFTPATYNDPALVQRLVGLWRGLLGEENVVEREPEMGGEDFSRFGMEDPKIPVFLFRVGTIDAERMAAAKRGEAPLPSLHSPLYWPAPHPTIETGVKALVSATLELLKK